MLILLWELRAVSDLCDLCQTPKRSRRERWGVKRVLAVLACGFALLILGSSHVRAQSPETTPSVEAPAAQAAHAGVDTDNAQEKERARQAAIAGLMVLGLVAVVLVLLMVMAMWWAHRLRRQIERPLPKQHPGDPLWYLRKGSSEGIDAGHDSDTPNENSNG